MKGACKWRNGEVKESVSEDRISFWYCISDSEEGQIYSRQCCELA